MDDEPELLFQCLDDKRWLVAYIWDNGPTAYSLYHRNGKIAEFSFSDSPS